MESIAFSVKFMDVSPAQANRWAGELKEAFLDSAPQVRVSQIREQRDHIDMGTALEVILGSAVLVEALKILQSWLIKRRDATVELRDGTRSIKLTGITVKDALAQVQNFLQPAPRTTAKPLDTPAACLEDDDCKTGHA